MITANYSGLVPDTFKSSAEVVASGKLGEGDVLQVIPDGIMAKCPSKYDAAKIGGGPPRAAWIPASRSSSSDSQRCAAAPRRPRGGSAAQRRSIVARNEIASVVAATATISAAGISTGSAPMR